jgi:hypothetical protein
MFKIFVVMLALLPTQIYAQSPQLKFEYQELGDSYAKYSCEYKHDSFYDWLVWCQKPNEIKKFRVHMAVRRYPKTVFGSSGYEVMYWISDITKSTRQIHHDSVTIWIHNSEDQNSLRALELRQGIENDLSQLNLYLSWQRRR